MMKFRKNNNYGETTNDISEYIGSRIFSLLGFDAQQVLLGIYQNEKVVLCKDFMTGRNFTPFNEVGESSLDHQKGDFSYSYDGIEEQIKANKKITDKEYALSLFWDTYIVDALIANKDRHGKNWGYMKKDNKYSPAPIFDNGAGIMSDIMMEYPMSIDAIHYIDKVKSKTFCDDFAEQVDIAEKLYGEHIRFSFGYNDVKSIVDRAEMYDEKIRNRTIEIVMQMRSRYKYLFSNV